MTTPWFFYTKWQNFTQNSSWNPYFFLGLSKIILDRIQGNNGKGKFTDFLWNWFKNLPQKCTFLCMPSFYLPNLGIFLFWSLFYRHPKWSIKNAARLIWGLKTLKTCRGFCKSFLIVYDSMTTPRPLQYPKNIDQFDYLLGVKLFEFLGLHSHFSFQKINLSDLGDFSFLSCPQFFKTAHS